MKDTTYLPVPLQHAAIAMMRPSGTLALVDEEHEKRMLGYYTVKEVRDAWDLAYRRYIQPAMFGEITSEEVVGRLDEVERMLSIATPALYGVEGESIYTQIARLRKLLSAPGKLKTIESRRPVRKATRRVYIELDRLALRTACPAFLPRMLKKLTGKTSVKISMADRERIHSFAVASLSGLSTTLGEKLKLEPRVVDAFSTLGLGVWATRAQVEERRRALALRYHPDREAGDATRMAKINDAVDVLVAEYFRNVSPPEEVPPQQ